MSYGALIVASLLWAGCSGNTHGPGGDDPGTGGEEPVGQSEFSTPGSAGGGGRYGGPGGAEGDAAAGGAQPGAPAPSNEAGGGNTSVPRLIEEADLYRLVGNNLFVLNRYRGLQVIDLTNLDNPRVIGHAPIFGYPKEMYVRGTKAYVIVSDYYSFWRNGLAEDGGVGAFYGSQIRVLDIADPTHPRIVGAIDVQGDVTDSRIVGDVLYMVSERYAWYWRYESDDDVNKTVVMSVDISDEANIHVIEQIDFPLGGWEQHLSVTANTIYVSSSGWEQGAAGYVTKIQYVDISDPAGHIVKRGLMQVPGRVMDRWSMDEYDHVFRVASGQSWGNGDVYLTTFSVANPDAPVQLGRATLHVNENLTSARFDGTKGYLVTYRNIDPLFVFDLVNPAQPTLLGELVMTGWLDFMVPMGDRIVALGHEDTNANGQREISLAVSLVKVEDGTPPVLLDRVVMGGSWGWIPAERDDFAKVFKVLPQEGLVMFPFQAWSRTDWRYIGGVQLIDYARNDLTERGLIRDAGWVERSIPHSAGTILTLANELFQVMDITDRDHPRVRGRLELARNVQDFAVLPGGYSVQLTGDWYMGDTNVTVTPLLDPDTATPTAKVHVPAPYGRMFVNGSFAYVASVREGASGGASTTRVQVVDLTNPAAPRVRGEIALPEQVWLGYHSWYWGWGDEVVQINGSLLAFHRFRYNWCWEYDGCSPSQLAESVHKIYLVSLANPDAPALVSTIELDDAAWAWGLRAYGNTLALSEYRTFRDSANNNYTTRYYLRRIDITNPASPVVRNPVNIPGTLVAMSANGLYAYTMENWWDQNWTTPHVRVNALALLGDTAYLRSSVELQGYMSNAQLYGDQIFLTTNWGRSITTESGSSRWVNQTELVAVSVANPRALAISGRAQVPYDYGYLQKVKNGRAFVGSGAGIFSFIVTDPTQPFFEGFYRTQGWANDLVIAGSYLFVPSGYYGVQVIDLNGSH